MQHKRCKLAQKMIGGTPNLYVCIMRHGNVSISNTRANNRVSKKERKKDEHEDEDEDEGEETMSDRR